MLIDLFGRETRRQSYSAAQALLSQLEPSVQLRRFPLRQADFFVLNAPDVPSVLIELGFLSNSDDTENLTTDAWLNRVAAALARGWRFILRGRGRRLASQPSPLNPSHGGRGGSCGCPRFPFSLVGEGGPAKPGRMRGARCRPHASEHHKSAPAVHNLILVCYL